MRFPQLPRNFRWLVILWGGALFFWISLEDRSSLHVAVLGAGSALILAIVQIAHRFGGRTLSTRTLWVTAPLLGALIGAGGAVATALLMFLKTAIHAHVFPDFPPMQIIAMLERAPAWAGAGILISTGLLFAYTGLRVEGAR
jgi:hypothetical protein